MIEASHDAPALRDHLGRGWAFPPIWNEAPNGSPQVHMVSRLEDIRQSIRIILETALGSRVMQPEFGSDVHRYVFAPIDARTTSNLANDVRHALNLWERRIREIEVTVTQDEQQVSRLNVEITFEVETHRMRQNLVFPFYIEQPEVPR